MSSEDQRLFIGSYWAPRGGTLGDCLAQSLGFIHEFRKFMPRFNKVFLWGTSQKTSEWLADDLSDVRQKAGQKLLKKLRLKGNPENLLEIPSKHGFLVSVSNSAALMTDPDYVGISLSLCGPVTLLIPDSCLLEWLPETYPEASTLEALERILSINVRVWSPDYTVVTTKGAFSSVRSFDEMQAGYKNIGLLTYFSNRDAAELLAQFGVVRNEGNGIVLQISESLDDLKTEEVLGRARAAKDAYYRFTELRRAD